MNDNTFHFFIKREGWPLTDKVGYYPAKKSICPKCNSDKITIFFKPGFIGKEISKWCDFMDSNSINLCDSYEIIKKSNYNPNWICKYCYNGGVILK